MGSLTEYRPASSGSGVGAATQSRPWAALALSRALDQAGSPARHHAGKAVHSLLALQPQYHRKSRMTPAEQALRHPCWAVQAPGSRASRARPRHQRYPLGGSRRNSTPQAMAGASAGSTGRSCRLGHAPTRGPLRPGCSTDGQAGSCRGRSFWPAGARGRCRGGPGQNLAEISCQRPLEGHTGSPFRYGHLASWAGPVPGGAAQTRLSWSRQAAGYAAAPSAASQACPR